MAETRQRPGTGATDLASLSRLENVMVDIREGKMDEELNALQQAIQERQNARKQGVLNLVKEVFGPNAVVTQPRGIKEAIIGSPEPNPEPVEETSASTTPDDAELSGDFESRSPIIGPFPPPD